MTSNIFGFFAAVHCRALKNKTARLHPLLTLPSTDQVCRTVLVPPEQQGSSALILPQQPLDSIFSIHHIFLRKNRPGLFR
jgi:hypothetical protein